MQYSTWQSAGKELKLHGRVWGPGGTCSAQVLKLSKSEFRPGKAGAKGERCTGGFRVLVKRAWRRCGNRLNAIFDLAKRCGKGLNKLHGGFACFETLLNAEFRPGKARARAKGDGKALARG